jgi:molybdate transport system permease protein
LTLGDAFSYSDLTAIWLTVELAALVTVLLLIIGSPIAWWLARTPSRWKRPLAAVVALPLVLPPTVLGFYLLVALGARSPIGRLWTEWTGHPLAFTFEALVIASILYSLPFAVQPMASSFSQVDRSLLDASATLGADRLRTFGRIVLPLSIHGVLAAAVLSFAHTVGEFGVVLMVGGNLPGVTRTVSISIYDDVQGLNFGAANQTALALLVFSFAVLALVYSLIRGPWSVAAVPANPAN